MKPEPSSAVHRYARPDVIPQWGLRGVVVAALLWACGLAQAQLAASDPDWQEVSVAPPSRFDAEHTLPIELAPHVSVRIGVVPASVTLGADGVLRYVAVATNPQGQRSALFEGIHCARWQVKTYAHWNPESGWHDQPNPAWRDLMASAPSLHARAIARQGACDGTSARRNADEVLHALSR